MAERARMEKHITLLGVLHIVYHALGLLVGIVIFGVLSVIGRFTGDPYAASILMAIGSAIAIFFIVLSVPGIVAGIWLLQKQGWARILTFVVGALGLVDIPLGTALGVYTFWVLMQDDAVELFKSASGPVQTQTPHSE